MITLDDLKVAGAAGGGLGHHWLLDLDMIMSIAVTTASLIYVILKIRELIKKGDKI